MSDRVTTFDEPKRYLDEEDLRDAMDDLWKYIDGLKKTIMELEEGNQQMVALLDISHKNNTELVKANLMLKQELKLGLMWVERD